MSNMTNDPRFSAYLRNVSGVQRFIAMGLYMLLDSAGLLDKMVEASRSDLVFDRVVAGKPLIHWLGKGEDQLTREGLTPKQIAEVLELLSPKPEPSESPVEMDTMSFTGQDPASEGDAGEAEPTFGTPPLPLSSLAPLSDAELLKIPGISRATIKRIRAITT